MVIKQAILHIMDIDNEAVICTNQTLDLEEKEIFDYISLLVEKALNQDAKTGTLAEDNEIKNIFFGENKDFIESSKEASQLWHDISRGIEMPAGDYLVVSFSNEGINNVALIKLVHNEQITHFLDYNDEGIVNKLIVNRTLLPKPTSKLKEAIVISENGSYRLIETKYIVEGEKNFYLGQKYLKTKTSVHTIEDSLKEVKKIVKDIAKDSSDEEYEITSKLQEAVYETVEKGYLDLDFIEEKVFENKEAVKEKFAKKIDEKELVTMEVTNHKQMAKKYEKQKFKLDNGIEISIPMEVYQDKEIVEFINQPDGTLSVLIKNIDKIKNKF